MAHVIGVNGLRKLTSDMVDDAMDLLRRSRKNFVEDGSDGESLYAGEWTMKGVATLDKDSNIGVAARVVADPAGPINEVIEVGGEAGTDISLRSKSTGDAEISMSVIVRCQLVERKPADAN